MDFNIFQKIVTKFPFHFRALDAYIDCEIVATPGKYDFKPHAYGFQKDSPFLPLFNYYLKTVRK